MKRIITIAAAILLAAASANAQAGLLDAIKGAASQTLKNVLTGTTAASTIQLAGTWKYNGAAVATSSDNILGTVAGGAVNSTIENKLDGYLGKVGIKPGVATVTFGTDYSFKFSVGKAVLNGTWEQEGDKVTLKFGKAMTYLTLDGILKGTANGCELLFDADKFLVFAEKAASIFAKVSGNAAVGTVTSLISNVNGLDAGFKLVK